MGGRIVKVTLPVEPSKPCKQREKEVLREAAWQVVPLKSWMDEGRRDVMVEKTHE